METAGKKSPADDATNTARELNRYMHQTSSDASDLSSQRQVDHSAEPSRSLDADPTWEAFISCFSASVSVFCRRGSKHYKFNETLMLC